MATNCNHKKTVMTIDGKDENVCIICDDVQVISNG